jgi:hypothetical protein
VRLHSSRRDVAQPGSAPALGAGGREFKSRRPDRRRVATLLAVVLAIAAPASGCAGGDDEPEVRRPLPPPRVVPTREEWATRLHGFLRTHNEDIRVLNTLQDERVRVFLLTGEEETIETLNGTFERLSRCSSRLRGVGRPPPGERALARALTELERACRHYDRLGQLLLEALPLYTSDEASEQEEGGRLIVRAATPSRLAARHYRRAVSLLTREGLVRDVVG